MNEVIYLENWNSRLADVWWLYGYKASLEIDCVNLKPSSTFLHISNRTCQMPHLLQPVVNFKSNLQHSVVIVCDCYRLYLLLEFIAFAIHNCKVSGNSALDVRKVKFLGACWLHFLLLNQLPAFNLGVTLWGSFLVVPYEIR
jgi:hypothetical protein